MADLIGKQIGNYQLLQLLSKGGFADVYLAEHIHLNTMAAIKVLQTRLVGNAVEQFRDEARFVARLKHPHIIQILDFGVENDTPYLIMEFAAQGTLRQRHPNGTPVQPTEIVSYVQQVANALQYAHNQRVIHRDIKPENMLLGSNNEVLLSDFGLAMTNPSSRQSTKELIGTIAYMLPEQIQGKPQIASDQYALGIAVYKWVTGMRPFQGSFVELTVQHLSALPPSIRQHIPTLLPDVEEVIFKVLAKDPQQRFGSVQAFAQALEQAYTPTLLLLDVREDASTIKASLPGQEPERQPQALPASSTTTAWLSDTINRISLTSDSLTIGRASDNQFVVNDSQVSGHHARIHLQSGMHRVTDLGSTNGTFVNEQRLAAQVPYQLSQRDVIRIGNTSYTYTYDNSPQIAKISHPSNPGVGTGSNPAQTVTGYGDSTIVTPSPMRVRVTPSPIPLQPPRSPQQSKNRPMLWIGLGLVALILLSISFGIASAFAHNTLASTSHGNIQLTSTPTSSSASTPTNTTTPVPAPTDTPTPTPTDTPTPTPTPVQTQSPYGTTPTLTMQAFCNDLYNQAYRLAYSLFSNQLQNASSFSSFEKGYYLARCGYNNGFSPAGNEEQTTTQIGYPNGAIYNCTYYLIQDSGGYWEINSNSCIRTQ